jgi:hypothetical protein
MPRRVTTSRRSSLLYLTVTAGALAVGLLLAEPTPAQPLARPPLPLPADEQALVNVAIDRGVAYLKGAQNPWGTWGTGKEPGAAGGHMVGYTALPALTLLECGVQPDHLAIVRAAAAVRASWAKIDTTYELALSILFLDRLGDPKDRALIETFALRLIAGQTPSGGWSYRCPTLNQPTQRQLLAVLRQLNPTAGLFLLPNELALVKPTEQEAKTLGRLRMVDPGPVERCQLKPGGAGRVDLARVREDAKQVIEPGLARVGPRSLGDLSLVRAGGSLWESNNRQPDPVSIGRLAPRPGQCIKFVEAPTPDGDGAKDGGRPGADKGGARDGGKEADPKPAKAPPAVDPAKVVIPAVLAPLPVLREVRRLDGWTDPKDQLEVPTYGTTDNSNSQFAILALWVAQRQGIPMERTMDLVVRRYRGSQNADGGWGYRYQSGGGVDSTAAMTCVGLIGLAVGHGLAHEAPAAGNVRDPLLVNGFVALGRHVGDPAGRVVNVPMNNLYFLWSVERVAVLYNLPKIGDKDWYRWGAESLLSNQGPNGEWAKGGYPGAHPVLDTCLALLFLRRANLAVDLTNRLPFNPEQLANDIGKGQAREKPPAKEPSPTADRTEPAPTTKLPPLAAVGSRPDAEVPGRTPETGPLLSRVGSADGTEAPKEGSGGGGRWWLWVLLVVFGLLLVGGGAALWFGRGRKEEPSEPRRKGRGKKQRVSREDNT